MKAFDRIFRFAHPTRPILTWADAILLFILGTTLCAGVLMAEHTPKVIKGIEISLSPIALPYYACLSMLRMTAAYLLSLVFTLTYGYMALRSKRAEAFLLPVLDILQSVPILSFLPVVLLSLAAIIPQGLAAEIAAIVLIFTSQAWNMTFVWYQSLTTQPNELKEACRVFRFNGWMRFRILDLPFGMVGLIWNSMMSWAGGWFFLMASEMFNVSGKDFRLPGLGAYLQEAANKGNQTAIFYGVTVLIVIIVVLDQFLWRPLLAWSDRFRVEMTEGDQAPQSWFYDVLATSQIAEWFREKYTRPGTEKLDGWLAGEITETFSLAPVKTATTWGIRLLIGGIAVGLVIGVVKTATLLFTVKPWEWIFIFVGVMTTFLRVATALILSLAWTIPVGVAIGTNRKVADWLQPIAQIAASVPPTALYPAVLLWVLALPHGLEFAAVVLMILGTQWYLLFNIIAGSSAIPQDLRNTARILQLPRFEFWRTLILPALFPYIVTGAIAASGGAWNASVVAEYVTAGGEAHQVPGIGAAIADATANSNYPALLGGTLVMILTVVAINRLFWRRLYRLAEERYRID